MEAVRAVTWLSSDQSRERDRVYGYAILTDTELFFFALSGKNSERVSRQTRKDVPQSQVDKVLEKFEEGKAKNPYRLQRSELTAVGYIKAAGRLRIETGDQSLDLGNFASTTDLPYVATAIATTVFPEIEPHSEQVAASLSVQHNYLKAIGSVAFVCIGAVILALIGGQEGFDSSARGSGIARMLGDIPLPALLVACAVALAYPIFRTVQQARQGYVMRVWLSETGGT